MYPRGHNENSQSPLCLLQLEKPACSNEDPENQMRSDKIDQREAKRVRTMRRMTRSMDPVSSTHGKNLDD